MMCSISRLAMIQFETKLKKCIRMGITIFNILIQGVYCRIHIRKSFYSPALAWTHTFVKIDHEIISTAILLPSAESRRVVVSYKQRYVHEVLVNCLVKFAQEKCVVR